jgi:hypothetical protein
MAANNHGDPAVHGSALENDFPFICLPVADKFSMESLLGEIEILMFMIRNPSLGAADDAGPVWIPSAR